MHLCDASFAEAILLVLFHECGTREVILHCILNHQVDNNRVEG